ncbi:unnamed protein product [Gongylonema pulchrum]|uniref:S1 motif domain-containing protein n=1 Tax=Gongylonema pulchrum TaxID=637853 RepID=A0A183E6Y3_9BILA|nr:unnamed protein product [Gongylonema pulchrum]
MASFFQIGHSNCDSFSDSNPLVKPFSSDSVSPAQTLTSKAKRDLITGSVVVPISANTALENIKIFRGVVTLLSGSFAVIQPEGHIGFLKNNRSDNSLRDLKIGDWVAVAGVQRGKSIAYDIINLPSLISAEAPTKVKRGTVLVLSEVKVEYANGNEFYASSPILGTVVGVTDFLARKDDCIVAWCCPRVCAEFEIFWEAIEFLTASNSVLSEVKVEYANGNEFYGNSPILGTVVGVTDFLARKDDFIVAWCCPRVCAEFEIFWEAIEFLTASNSVSSNGNFAFITFSKAV